MILSYVDILGDGKRHNINATITTDHPSSSYGQPVILLDDGQTLNAESWILMAYQIAKATEQEIDLCKRWISLVNLLLDVDNAASIMGRKGGSKTSAAKKKSSAANGRLGGRPREHKS